MSSAEAFPTSLRALDELLIGGMPNALVQIFGPPGVGKSTLALQIAFQHAARSGRSVLYLDTELSLLNLLDHKREAVAKLVGKAIPDRELELEYAAIGKRSKRIKEAEIRRCIEAALHQIGLEATHEQLQTAASLFTWATRIEDAQESQPALFHIRVPSLTDVLALHGARVDVGLSDGGKAETKLLPGTVPPEASELAKFCEKHNVGLMIYDSISQPIQAWYLCRASFPARAALYRLWLGRAEVLAKRYRMAILALNHASREPLSGMCFHWGGAPVSYSFKFSLCMEEFNSRALSVCLNKELAEGAEQKLLRVVWVRRHPAWPPDGACVLLRLNEEGLFTC